MDGSILIVDDEPDICWALEHILEPRGLSCHRSLTAQDAIELMKRIRFHLAFLDVTLPDMQGLELAKRLKLINPDLNIVIVTGYMPPDDETPSGAKEDRLYRACIYKPFLNQEVLNAVDECW